ncbi:MAG: hypothetical protein WB779_16435 [Ignavibacteriaceae bacterium]|jgi:hypothetical protein
MNKGQRLSGLYKAILFIFIIFFSAVLTEAQTTSSRSLAFESPSSGNGSWLIGGKLGMAIGSGFGGSSVGLQIGPMGEYKFNSNMAIGTELNINTFGGTPVEWADYFKYYFEIPGSDVKPYADAGLSLWFSSGGPYFAIRFGGGANFKIAKNLYIPADLQIGPVFYSTKTVGFDPNTFQTTTTSSSNTIFYVAITTGIRYELP